MNNEDLLRMAKEAGFHIDKRNDIWQPAVYKNLHTIPFTDEMGKFAALVHAAAVNEAVEEMRGSITAVIAGTILSIAEECAKVCDAEFERTKPMARGSSYYEGRNDGADALGEAIRAKYQDQATSTTTESGNND